MAINNPTAEGDEEITILTIDGSPGLAPILQHILATTEAAAVVNTTICNGRLDQSEEDHKTRTTMEVTQILYSHLLTILNIQAMIRTNLRKKKRIFSDHRRSFKWRIGRISGHLKVQTTKVILQLRTPNSALLSSPKLLKRLQLKLLQISIPR